MTRQSHDILGKDVLPRSSERQNHGFVWLQTNGIYYT